MRYLPSKTTEEVALNNHFCEVFTKVNGESHLKRDKFIFNYVSTEKPETQHKIDY